MIRLNQELLSISRDDFINQLREFNVGTSVRFIPLHIHPYYRDKCGYQPLDCPVATESNERIVSLPLYSRMRRQDVEYVAESVTQIVKQNRT